MIFLIIFIIIFLLDRIFKILIFHILPIGISFPIVKDVFHITPVFNKGIAFGLFTGLNNYVLISIALTVLLCVLYILIFFKIHSIMMSCGLVLIASGALCNVIDRVFYGSVLDFIDLRIWPVFNIADSAITIGAFLILFYLVNPKSKCTLFCLP